MIIKHQRRLNRLKNFDYSKNGYYFITVCVDKRKSIFGEIKNKKMILNKYGKIIDKQWLWLEKQYPYIKLDVYQIMPNHFHGIIIINKNFIINNNPHNYNKKIYQNHYQTDFYRYQI